MRAKEFIVENLSGSIQDDVARALPATYVLPELKNQDAYLQYRFGVALAAARGEEERKKDGMPAFASSSAWGENQVIVSYDPDIGELIDKALAMMGKSEKKLISTPTSQESSDVDIVSTIGSRTQKDITK